MSNWNYKSLSELCDINIGKTPARNKKEYWGKGYTWVSISDLKEKFISNTKEEITEKAIGEANCKVVPKGTLLMSFKLSIGKLSFANKDLYTNEAIVSLPIKNRNELDNEYLYFALKFIPLVGGNQAAMGQTLNKKTLSILKIPLPNLTDQKRIAKVLSDAETLISQRKESINLLDELLKSTFLDMFGDINNPKFSLSKLSDYSIKITDGTHQSPKFIEKGIPFLLVSNIVNNEINYTTKKFISNNDYEILNKRTPIEIGDILFTSVGSYGKPALVKTNIKFAFQRHIAYIKPNSNKINNVYLFGALQSNLVKNQVEKVVRGVAQKTLNLRDLKNIKIPIPPITLQNKFAQIVEQTEVIKKHYEESLQELEKLYGSMSQRAFKGDLDLSEVEGEEKGMEYLSMAAEDSAKYGNK